MISKNHQKFADLAAEKFGVSEIRRGELEEFARSINMAMPMTFLKAHCSGMKKGYYCFVKFMKPDISKPVNTNVVTITDLIGEATKQQEEPEMVDEFHEPFNEDDGIIGDIEEDIDGHIKAMIDALDEEDQNEVIFAEADKDFKKKLLNKITETFVNPVFVVFNEGQCICWGTSFSFDKAYQIAVKRALHGVPSISEAEAKKLIDKQGFVRLIHAACKSLPAVIYKVELEA